MTAAIRAGTRWTGALTGHTAVGDRVLFQVGFRTAGVRLRGLARNGMLEWACEVAYGEGITALIELASRAAGLTRLASACLADLTETGDRAHIALQWDAIDADGTLFTALLADLMLVPAGEQASVLSLAGAYWPPPGQACAGLDQVTVHCCVTAITAVSWTRWPARSVIRLRCPVLAHWTRHVNFGDEVDLADRYRRIRGRRDTGR